MKFNLTILSLFLLCEIQCNLIRIFVVGELYIFLKDGRLECINSFLYLLAILIPTLHGRPHSYRLLNLSLLIEIGMSKIE